MRVRPCVRMRVPYIYGGRIFLRIVHRSLCAESRNINIVNLLKFCFFFAIFAPFIMYVPQ